MSHSDIGIMSHLYIYLSHPFMDILHYYIDFKCGDSTLIYSNAILSNIQMTQFLYKDDTLLHKDETFVHIF